MKSLLIILLATITVLSCKKSDDPPIKKTILGKWTNGNISDKKPTIKQDSILWDNVSFGSDSISIKSDTIFTVYRSAPKEASWVYFITTNNDTLKLSSIVVGTSHTYWRIK